MAHSIDDVWLKTAERRVKLCWQNSIISIKLNFSMLHGWVAIVELSDNVLPLRGCECKIGLSVTVTELCEILNCCWNIIIFFLSEQSISQQNFVDFGISVSFSLKMTSKL